MGRLMYKLKGSTLMESIIATIIIVAVFVIASLILSKTYKGVVQNDTFLIENRMEELFYLVSHERLSLPYEETFGNFELYISEQVIDEVIYVQAEALNDKQSKSIMKIHVGQ